MIRGIIIIPAFNEACVIENVLKRIPKKVNNVIFDVIVINDGSVDNTEEVVKRCGVRVLTHIVNRGLGAALGTGFEYARKKGYDLLVTLDADGQHDPSELDHLIKPIIDNKADFVVGTRLYKKGMPTSRKVITFLASVATFVFTNVWSSDSQSGYRVFSKRAIESIFIEVDRMEVSSDFFRQALEKKLRLLEVPIKPIYTDYSIKKGQNYFNSVNIIGKLLFRRLIS